MIPCNVYPLGTVIPIFFTTYATADGASITASGLAVTDIEIYKGVSITQRSSDNGYALIDTDGLDVDSTTGLHAFSVDTGDNTDAGFFVAGSIYHVVVNAITVDTETVVFIAEKFRLVAAENTAGVPVVDTVRISNTTQTARDIGASVLLSSGTGTGQVKLSGGYVAPNWGDVGNPTTSLNLSGTTVKTATDVETDTADIQSRIPAALTGDGNMKADTLRLGGTLQTARDIGASVLLSSGTGTGQVKLSSGYVAPNWADVGNPSTTVNLSATTINLVNTATTLTNAPSDTSGITTLLSRLSALRAGYLDNLSSGAVALASGVTVTTNSDKTGYALTSGERNSVADAILDRDMSAGTDSGSATVRTVRQALRFLRNKWAVATGTLTVYKEDDSTPSWSGPVSTDAAADPITGVDPASS